MATQEDILRKVRALLDRANSTEFEGERDACLAKADALMMAHAIEQWQLEQANPHQAAQPVRVDLDFSWYYDEKNREVASAFWLLFIDCAAHCRCVLAHTETSWSREQGFRIPVFGLNSDISYLGMMFTDLLIQLSKKLRPVYNPELSDGENIYHARESGMSYRHIARWMGRDDLVTHKNGKVTVAGYLKREGDRYAKSIGAKPHTLQTQVYTRSFVSGFVQGVRHQLQQMRNDQRQEHGSGMELVVRSAREKARDLMYDTFESMRPKESDNDKPVKYRKEKLVAFNYDVARRGNAEGLKANIAGQHAQVKNRKGIEQ